MQKYLTNREPCTCGCLSSCWHLKLFEGCLGCRENETQPTQANPQQIHLVLKKQSVCQSAHTAAATPAEGSCQQEVEAVHFPRLLPLVLILHAQGCPGSPAIRNDLCQRAHYKNHLSFLVHV